MEDKGVIELLSENVSNQIAAGEVVQRPASVVKELMENAVDAGATAIELFIQEAGKTIIQVSDNGAGMSGRDLQLAFERHATSKIKKAEDLFEIMSMGFRGEALASIAAVSSVRADTKRKSDEMGWSLEIAGGKREKMQMCQTNIGTRISVKNLFYNIPARRNFLKSDSIEFRHLSDEFQRIALAYPSIFMKLEHNGSLIYSLNSSSFRRRITAIFGYGYDERLVPVEEKTDILEINGFVCKPEYARKVRGEQFLFVNSRYIKSLFLNHSVNQAFKNLLPEGKFPSYFLNLKIDPKHIDINIHPTKTEIKFDDEKTIHTMLRVSIKHALGQYNISPTIDFEREPSFFVPDNLNKTPVQPRIKVDQSFNPFEVQHSSPSIGRGFREMEFQIESQKKTELFSAGEFELSSDHILWSDTFIATVKSHSLRLIHIQRAQFCISYNKLLKTIQRGTAISQQLLFPQNLEYDSAQMALLDSILPEIRKFGYDIEIESINRVNVIGLPFGIPEGLASDSIDGFLELERNSAVLSVDDRLERMAYTIAKTQARASNSQQSLEERMELMNGLERLKWPLLTADGEKIWSEMNKSEIEKILF